MSQPVCADCGTPRLATWPIARCSCGSTLVRFDAAPGHVHTEADDFAALIPPAQPIRVVPTPTPPRRHA